MKAFNTVLKKFGNKGEKTGWTYIEIPAKIAEALKPGNKKSFRVKGKLDDHIIEGIAVLPAGDGSFIMAVNATMRKAIKKQGGAPVKVQIEEDEKSLQICPELMECLRDEPEAMAFFNSLATGHRNYFSKYIESAKTEATKTKRIAQTVSALGKKYDFGLMIRTAQKARKEGW